MSDDRQNNNNNNNKDDNDRKTNEFIKFMINTDGFIDPYSLLLDVTVEVDPTTTGVGGMILDGLSTSLVQELIITQQSTNRELERVTEYD